MPSYHCLHIYYVTPFSDCIGHMFRAGFQDNFFLSRELPPCSIEEWLKSHKCCFSSRPPERKSVYLNHSPERESCHVPPSSTVPVSVASQSPLAPQTSTPAPKPGTHSCQESVSVRKRRRLAASPGGLHWNASGMPQPGHPLWKYMFPIRALSFFTVSLLLDGLSWLYY